MARRAEKKKYQDAFGMALAEVQKGNGDVVHLVERSDGFFEAEKTKDKYFCHYEKWLDIEKKAIKFVKGRILDIGVARNFVEILKLSGT